MKYKIITIEREYASGGSEIGRITGEQLGIPCYGREVLEQVAVKMGTIPEKLEHLEETATNSLLYSISMASMVAVGVREGLSRESALYLEESNVIKEMALRGPCVIVGRCAGWILRDRKDVLNVFIHGDKEFRIQRAIGEYNIPAEQAEDVLHRFDKRRSGFYRSNTCMKWDSKEGYHLVADSSKLGIQGCADIICQACRG